MFTESIAIVRPTWVGGVYSSEKYLSWDSPTYEFPDVLVAVEPDTASEIYDGLGSTRLLTGYRLITPPGVLLEQVTSIDRILVMSLALILEVNGAPAHFRSVVPHTEIQLQILDKEESQ